MQGHAFHLFRPPMSIRRLVVPKACLERVCGAGTLGTIDELPCRLPWFLRDMGPLSMLEPVRDIAMHATRSTINYRVIRSRDTTSSATYGGLGDLDCHKPL